MSSNIATSVPAAWPFDTPISARYPIYTRANAGEVLVDPVTPLNLSLAFVKCGEAGWRDAYVSTGALTSDEFEDFTTNTIGCFGGYLYLNMSVTRIFGARAPGMTPEMVDLQYFGTMPGIPPYVERPGDQRHESTVKMQQWLDWMFSQSDLPELRADATRVDAIVAGRPDLAALSDVELLARARSMQPEYRGLFERHIRTSAAIGFGVGTVSGVCEAIGRPELAMTLCGSAGDVESAAPSFAMWDLSRLVRISKNLTAQFHAGVPGIHERLISARYTDRQADVGEFLVAMDELLANYGCRGPNEWELRSLTWDLKPELVYAAIDRMRFSPDDQSPERSHDRGRRAREAAEVEVRGLLAGPESADALAQFGVGLRAALLFASGRERSKTNNIKIVHEQRLALRELGRRMVERGHLDSVEQVFMLADDELDGEIVRFIADPAPWRDVLRRREADYLALFDLEPPFVLFDTAPDLTSWAHRGGRTVELAKPGDVLSGIAGCAGVVEGRARIVLDPSDPMGLEPGDILVAPNTDPAWTPLFVPAAGVIVDVGAQITHAVIVSRELNIPCVVSVTDATRKIADGTMVRVDGSNGTVTIL